MWRVLKRNGSCASALQVLLLMTVYKNMLMHKRFLNHYALQPGEYMVISKQLLL